MPTYTPNFNYSVPTPFGDANVWGTELNSNLTAQDTYLNSAANTFIASSAPSTPALAAGRLWINNTSSPWPLSVYDGSNWLTIGTINPTTHVWTPTGATVPNIVTMTASGTYTPSAGLVYATIELVGGGGGGGGANIVGSGVGLGTGGAAGGYCNSILTASTIGASQTVTIGAGGAGGPNTGGNGTTGGTTSFGSLMTATGGSGGLVNYSTNDFSVGGVKGGTGSGGNILNLAGNFSSTAFYLSVSGGGQSGPGAGSRLGSEVNGGYQSAGNAGYNYGSGGSGAWSTTTSGYAGGTGSAGVVIITEYL